MRLIAAEAEYVCTPGMVHCSTAREFELGSSPYLPVPLWLPPQCRNCVPHTPVVPILPVESPSVPQSYLLNPLLYFHHVCRLLQQCTIGKYEEGPRVRTSAARILHDGPYRVQVCSCGAYMYVHSHFMPERVAFWMPQVHLYACWMSPQLNCACDSSLCPPRAVISPDLKKPKSTWYMYM